MTNLPEQFATDEDDIVDVTSEFFQNCGGNPQFQISILDKNTREVEFLPISKPYAIVGRGRACDLKLEQRDISYRHAYLQMLRNRLLVVDLGSRVGTQWKGKRRRSGWLLPGREIEIANYVIKLVKWKSDSTLNDDDSDIDVKSVLEQGSQPFPQASLELLSVNSQSRTGRVLTLKPGVTLIGRSRVAQVRLKHESVSHVHSSLVLTPDGLWVVDLLGRGGTHVNDAPVQFARLQNSDVIQVGAFHLRAETSLMKPLAGVAKSKLKSRESLADTSYLLGDSTLIPRSDSASIDSGDEYDSSDADVPVIDDGSAVMREVDADSARWAEIIDALKSGGFGS